MALRRQRSWTRRTQQSRGQRRSVPTTTGRRSRSGFCTSQVVAGSCGNDSTGNDGVKVQRTVLCRCAAALPADLYLCARAATSPELQADPGAAFVEQYGPIQPVPQHDGTECLKWDDSLWSHADHFKVLLRYWWECSLRQICQRVFRTIFDNSLTSVCACAAVPLARVQEHTRGH